ncbi:phage minor head protein [uncultured Pseudacidovorax sp.]|uniref:phage head morphogenesis protein n=1 Tax=uncultured Pseudacidovorax sp. TaxID=679313 RepID=UPI0025FAF94C|nr:phage minor head protein [uncultured Pseudacidovorax sp.]
MATAPDAPAAVIDGVRLQLQSQIDFLRQKLALPTERYDQIKGAAHNRAFMVAGMTKADMLADTQEALVKSVRGESIETFRKDFSSVVQRYGWTGWTGEGSKEGEAWRTRVIYTTNVMTARAAGRRAQLLAPELLARRPYWLYRHSDRVEHPRPWHKAWGDMRLTLRYDAVFWATNFPPNGFGCLCDVVPVAAPADGAATEPPEGWDVPDPATGRLPGVEPGWDYAPGADMDVSMRELVARKLIDYPPAIARALTGEINAELVPAEPVVDFVQRAVANPATEGELWLGFLEDAEAAGAAVGADLRGYGVTLPAEAVRASQLPAMPASERAPAPEDFLRLMTVLNVPDALEAGPLTDDGQRTLVATRKVGREGFRAVFGVLDGADVRTLALRLLGITRRVPR